MYIAYSLLIGFEMPNEYDEMEKFKAENEGFTETVTTSNYIMFQKNLKMVCSLPIKRYFINKKWFDELPTGGVTGA